MAATKSRIPVGISVLRGKHPAANGNPGVSREKKPMIPVSSTRRLTKGKGFSYGNKAK